MTTVAAVEVDSSSPVIAIELGRVECRVGLFRYGDGEVEVFQDDNLKAPGIPSWIYFKEEDGGRVIGSVAKEMGVIHPQRAIFAGSLLDYRGLGFRVDAEKINFPLERTHPGGGQYVEMLGKPGISVQVGVAKKTFYLEQVVAMLLRHLKEIAERRLGVVVHQAVLTIPTGGLHWRRVQTLRHSATIAGLTRVRFLSRCQAAGIWYEFSSEHDESRAQRKNPLIKVVDYEMAGEDRYAWCVLNAKEVEHEGNEEGDVLEEVMTSPFGYRCEKINSMDATSNLLGVFARLGVGVRGQLPDTMVVFGRNDQRKPDVNIFEPEIIQITQSEFSDRESYVLNGAAVYAAFMMKNGFEGLQLKPAVPRGLGVVDATIATGDFQVQILSKHTRFEGMHKAMIRVPVACDGVLHLKVYEGELGKEGRGKESDFLGTIQIVNFEAVGRRSNVELTFQVSFSGSLDVTASCKKSGKPCQVRFASDWFTSSFRKEDLEAFRLQEMKFRRNPKKTREIPSSSSSTRNFNKDLATIKAYIPSTIPFAVDVPPQKRRCVASSAAADKHRDGDFRVKFSNQCTWTDDSNLEGVMKLELESFDRRGDICGNERSSMDVIQGIDSEMEDSSNRRSSRRLRARPTTTNQAGLNEIAGKGISPAIINNNKRSSRSAFNSPVDSLRVGVKSKICLYCGTNLFFENNCHNHMLAFHPAEYCAPLLPPGTTEQEMETAIEHVLTEKANMTMTMSKPTAHGRRTLYHCRLCSKVISVNCSRFHIIHRHFRVVLSTLKSVKSLTSSSAD